MANRTREEILALADTDPELVEALKATPYPEFDFSDPVKLVRDIRALINMRTDIQPDPQVTQTTVHVKTRDDFELRLLVFKPVSPPQAPMPLVVLYHGGGGTIGTPEQMTASCRDVVKQFNVVAIAPQYRLAPEYRWPTGTHDAWDVLKWIAANAESLGASPSAGFIVGGISNGGSLTGVLSHLARDEKLSPPITGLFLSAASFVTPLAVPEQYKDRYLSRLQDACLNAPVLDQRTKKLFDDCMQYDPHSPMMASLIWPTGHAGLPPTYFQACGMDINRDDSLIYEQVLREDYGVRTRIDIYPGMPHVFWGVWPNLQQTKKWYVDTFKGFEWLLGKKAVL